jgi:radical SAM superfamily enzyme
MLATADVLAGLPIQAIKIHNLYVVRDTPLEKMYRGGEVAMLEREQYVELICDFLERLPADRVIHRLSGEAPPDFLVAPLWCLDKPGLLRAIDQEFESRDSWQGKMVGPIKERSREQRRFGLKLIENKEIQNAGAGASPPG